MKSFSLHDKMNSIGNINKITFLLYFPERMKREKQTK